MASAAPEQPTSHQFRRVLATLRGWWRRAVIGTVDQAAVIADRREECQLSARYLFMLSMSAGIAILGLLLSSPAVVIGAMLLSPLMGPIMGLGFAIATGDFRWMKQASRSLLIGTVLSIVLCAVIVVLSPLQTVTTEIAARTRPNLFDLGIALFSALAGAYAMIRGQMGTVVGVAIATALMPPLAVVGFGLATLNWTVFSGALLLFFTNLMTIALTAAMMARLYGFRTYLSEKQTNFQTAAIVVAFVALAIPLGFTLVKVAREANDTRLINGAVLDPFDKRARLSQIEFDPASSPKQVSAVVLTPQVKPDAQQTVQHAVERILGEPVDLTLTQVQVGTSAQAAEVAQLSRARAQQEADLEHAQKIAERLALVAGTDPKNVLLDQLNHRAQVDAKPLAGAQLAAYRELESRIAKSEPDWQITLRPPARPLPGLPWADGKLTAQGEANLALIVWAAQRIDAPVRLAGEQEMVDALVARLNDQDVQAIGEPERPGRHPPTSGTVTATWGAPEG
jgi:uncharacterized hydrophobic protein (TIGR00271 family)